MVEKALSALNKLANFQSNEFQKELLLWENLEIINGNHNELQVLEDAILKLKEYEDENKKLNEEISKLINELFKRKIK